MIPLAVKAIEQDAFQGCLQLTIVNLGEGLEEIGRGAFQSCMSLHEIVIPPTVKAIKEAAFFFCKQLTVVNLGEGLEEIGGDAFYECSSLHEIIIPPAVKAIKEYTFHRCSQLTTVNLGEGLQKIGKKAFWECASLQSITIPCAVTKIHKKAFHRCTSLTSVVFCDEIEEFVTADSMREWWNHGVHEMCLSTYCFLVRCNVLTRLGLVRPGKWQTNIHGMLRRIPSIPPKGLMTYYDSIDSKLSLYDDLKYAPMLLELILWKSKIIEQLDGNNGTGLAVDMKMQCRTNSLTMVAIIVSNVLSFLTDSDDGNNIVGRDDNVEDSNSDEDADSDSDSDNDSDESVEDDDVWVDGDGEDDEIDHVELLNM